MFRKSSGDLKKKMQSFVLYFRFEYSVKDRKPYIDAISGMRENPLTGKFWFLYVIENGEPTLSNKSKFNEYFLM